jgi:hypothetical protein
LLSGFFVLTNECFVSAFPQQRHAHEAQYIGI